MIATFLPRSLQNLHGALTVCRPSSALLGLSIVDVGPKDALLYVAGLHAYGCRKALCSANVAKLRLTVLRHRIYMTLLMHAAAVEGLLCSFHRSGNDDPLVE